MKTSGDNKRKSSDVKKCEDAIRALESMMKTGDEEEIDIAVEKVGSLIAGRMNSALTGQADFEVILQEMGQTRLEKCTEYGEDRYDISKESLSEDIVLLWSDLHRKMLRVKTQAWRMMFNDRLGDGIKEEHLESFRESLLDIACYGGMGIQIVDKALRMSLAEK